MDKDEILLAEWKEIRETLRYFGNKRFAQLTVFIAAEGAAINVFLSDSGSRYPLVFQAAGLLLAVLFLAMERSSVAYWKSFAARGEAIEEELRCLELMTRYRPRKLRLLSATTATYVLYVSLALFWISALWWR